jgi:hypothetical protein
MKTITLEAYGDYTGGDDNNRVWMCRKGVEQFFNGWSPETLELKVARRKFPRSIRAEIYDRNGNPGSGVRFLRYHKLVDTEIDAPTVERLLGNLRNQVVYFRLVGKK